jgi:alpha-mannosidase
MTVDGKSLLARLFNAAGNDRPQRWTWDGRVGQVSLIELNGETREVLHSTVTPEGRTTAELAIPRFGVRTIRFTDWAPKTPWNP